MSTLAEIRSTLRDLGNFPSNDTRITDTVLDREINRALRRIAMIHDWPWLQAERVLVTAGGIQDYALPSDFLRLVVLRHDDTAVTLFIRSKIEVDEIVGSGRPQALAIWNGKIRLAPAPTDEEVLRLSYIRQEETLSNDSDEPLIPAYWEDGVLDAVLVQLYRIVNRPDDAGLAESRFQVWVSETADNVLQTRQAPRIRVRPGSYI